MEGWVVLDTAVSVQPMSKAACWSGFRKRSAKLSAFILPYCWDLCHWNGLILLHLSLPISLLCHCEQEQLRRCCSEYSTHPLQSTVFPSWRSRVEQNRLDIHGKPGLWSSVTCSLFCCAVCFSLCANVLIYYGHRKYSTHSLNSKN